jgi:hypothetical protein
MGNNNRFSMLVHDDEEEGESARLLDISAVVYVDGKGHLAQPRDWEDVPHGAGHLVMTWPVYENLFRRDLHERTVVVGGGDIWGEDCPHVPNMAALTRWVDDWEGTTLTALVTEEFILRDLRVGFGWALGKVEVVRVPDGGGDPIDVEAALSKQGFVKTDVFTWTSAVGQPTPPEREFTKQ